MKSLAVSSLLVIAAVVINFGIFLFSYNKIVFPHLTESQRMDIAPVIFSSVLLGYLASSIILVFLMSAANKYITKSST